MSINFLAVIVSAFIPMALGFLWYGPLFQKAWMRETGITEEDAQNGNMLIVFGVSFVMALILSFSLQFSVIHQFGVFGLVDGNVEHPAFKAFMNEGFATKHRTWTHGMLHGTMVGIMTILPVIATNHLFEQKSWKLIFINAGYWTVTLAIMGAILCVWI